MDEEIRFVRSSGNVFADMRLPDADEQLAKAQIAAQVARLISERDMTQGEIATMLGVTQPQVSALMRGRWEGVSLDRYHPTKAWRRVDNDRNGSHAAC